MWIKEFCHLGEVPFSELIYKIQIHQIVKTFETHIKNLLCTALLANFNYAALGWPETFFCGPGFINMWSGTFIWESIGLQQTIAALISCEFIAD